MIPLPASAGVEHAAARRYTTAQTTNLQRITPLFISVFVGVVDAIIHIYMPVNQRAIPGHLVHLLDGETIFLKAAEHDSPFVGQDQMLVPAIYLLYIELVSLFSTTCLAPKGQRLASLGTWLTATILCDCLTEFGKRFCGFLRPNFYSGCGWNETTHECAQAFPEGRLSFPSGRELLIIA